MQGQLFTQDFLRQGIREIPPCQAFNEAAFTACRSAMAAIFAPLRADTHLNEADTERLVIEPALAQLGWGADLLTQNSLSPKRREHVPDLLLLADATAMHAARNEPREDRRYRHGLAILEAKRHRPRCPGRAAVVEPQRSGLRLSDAPESPEHPYQLVHP